MSSRSSAALLVLSLALTGAAVQACPPRDSSCITKALRSGSEFQEINVGDRGVSWVMSGREHFEHVSLTEAEVQELSAAARAQEQPCVVRVNATRSSRAPQPATPPVLPYVGVGLVILLALLNARRRHGLTVRVLTPAAERRETGALIYTTLLVVGLVYATWPGEREVGAWVLHRALLRNQVAEATVRGDEVHFRVQGGRMLVVSTAEQAELKRTLNTAVCHVRRHGNPGEITHRPVTRSESAVGRLVSLLAPWVGALAFWIFWVRMIKRQSWW